MPKLLRNKIYSSEQLGDTVFIVESFDAICSNCPSDMMEVLFRDTIYSLNREILSNNTHGYKLGIELFDFNSKEDDYRLINSALIVRIRNNRPWTLNPLEYGSD